MYNWLNISLGKSCISILHKSYIYGSVKFLQKGGLNHNNKLSLHKMLFTFYMCTYCLCSCCKIQKKQPSIAGAESDGGSESAYRCSCNNNKQFTCIALGSKLRVCMDFWFTLHQKLTICLVLQWTCKNQSLLQTYLRTIIRLGWRRWRQHSTLFQIEFLWR